MANAPRGSTGRPAESKVEPPKEYPVVPPAPPPPDQSLELRDLVKAVAQLEVKTERLITDLRIEAGKVDTLRHQVSSVKGALWVMGILGSLLVLAFSAVSLYLKTNFPAHP